MSTDIPYSAVVPAPHDSVRIVPLHSDSELFGSPEGGAPAAAPQLTFRGGPLLTAVKVFTVYWGAAWSTAPLSDTAAKLDGFFDFVLTSPLLDMLGEYRDVNGLQVGHGSHIGRAVVTTPAPKHVVTDAGIQHLLQQELGANPAFPAADTETLYFVYLPPGTSVVQGGSRSCQAFCGYHNDIGGQIFYAAMPYPGCTGCTGTLTPFDALTSTSSHELSEAITDPIPGKGWYDDVNGEIGDICAWKTHSVGAYTVQSEWSNLKNACI
ncbi:hypothetical protein GCM10009760_30190 [Kitasatospora kazusensis]|uniref:Uncharacterized protein n=1 Tax=Kitasatospora kazusensis TaxID=407974 RepID=A0ABN2ZKE9_9ACTN